MTMAVAEHYLNLNGFSIRYLTAGTEGLPLILLHGDATSALDWSWVIPALAANYRVYAPDFPGFGLSSKPIMSYTPEFFQQFVVDFLDVLEIEKAIIIGNSLGGLVALSVALSHPARVAALGLVDSSGLGIEITPFLSQLTLPIYGELATTVCRTPLGAKQRSLFRGSLFFAHPGKIPDVWYADQENLAQMPGYMEASISALRTQLTVFGQYKILLDSLKQLTMPTLIVWGENDIVIPKQHGKNALKELSNGKLVVIPDCGHIPHIEQPEAFVKELRIFLSDLVF